MADDVLVRKVFNYICGGGGFSKLSLLLQSPSPLEKLQTEDEVKNWLRIQAVNDRRFVLVKNQNGEVNGVRIDLRKRICLQYTNTDTCKRAQGKCKFWHICRSYVEGNCDGNCGRSHDFHDDNNKEKTTELGLEKFPSGAVRNIVARSLPQVCVAYLKGECDSKKCAFLHVCSQTVRGNQCECLLSHQLINVNNKSILKQYDLVPHQAMKVEFVLGNILVPKQQKVYMLEATECSSVSLSSAAGKSNATSGIDSPCLSQTSEDNHQLPKTPAGLISGASEAKGTQEFPKETTSSAASKQEGTASLPEKKRRVRKRTARPKETTNREPNIVREKTSQPFLSIDEDMAKPALRVDHVNNLGHILSAEKSGSATKFLNIQEEEEGNVSDSSTDDNQSINLDDFTKYSKGENVNLATCKRGTQEALNTSGQKCQVASQRVNNISTHESNSSAQKKKKKKKKKNPGTTGPVNSAEPGTSTLNNSQSTVERDDYIADLLFKCLCTDFRCSASFSALQKREDLPLQELEDARAWFGARTNKFVITEDEDGSIRDVTAFCPKLRLCFDYVTLNECTKEMCPYFHLCKEFITGRCGSGGNCGKNHQFQNERDEEKLSWLNLDWLTNEQLRELMRSSAPQVCLDYNEGTCGNGFAYCSRLHICKRYVMKTCSDGDKCWLCHELTFQTCLLEKYRLARVKSEQVLKAILICEEEYEEEDEEDNEEEDEEEEEQQQQQQQQQQRQQQQRQQQHEEECQSAIETTSKPTSSSTPHVLSSKHASQTETEIWMPEGKKENLYGSAPSQESCYSPTARDEDMRERNRRLSVSSSCSSTMEPGETSPSKKTVFECLCKEYNCSVSFAVISQRQDLFPQGCGDIASWFRRQKDGFLLSENEDGTIAEVSAFCRRARLCFGHTSKEKCSKENCQYLHVCKSYVAGYCRFGGRCTMNHDFQDEKCRKVLSKLKLNGLTDEQLLKVVQLSSPQVCQNYNKRQCLKGDKCSQIHICNNFIRKKCDNEDSCSLEHEAGLRTAHARILLDKYGINPKGATGSDAILRMLVVCDDAPARPKRSKRKTSSKGASKESEKPRLKNEHSGDGSRALFTLPTKQPIPCTDNLWDNQLDAKAEYSETAATTSSTPVLPSVEPTEDKVFEAVCKQYHCSVSLSVVANRKDLFPEGCKNIDSWFRKWKSSFLITENDRGVITQIDAFSVRARLCLSYNNNGSCGKASCFCLHVCRDYVTENCSYGATCTRNHSFHNGRDIAFLSTIKLDQLTDEHLRKLVLSSTPQVCLDYNNGSCARGLSCTRIHTCKDFLRGSCSDDYYCDLDHESAMDTGHTLAVLERFHSSKDGSGQGRADHLRKIILVCDGPDMSSKETGHVHGDKPDAPICSDFLLGKCKKGRRCSGHHCSRPFNWQYKVPGPEEWKSFSEKDNDTLEKLFCDPVQDADVVQMEEGVKDLQICINGTGAATGPAYAYLEDDLIKLPGGLITKIRRMSTESFVISPSDPLATKWTWYWEDENGYWREYGNDSLGRDLQQMIEEAFCNKRTSYRFATSDHDYILWLNSTHRFQQQNLTHHTARDVKRRPLMLISDEEIQQLKRYYGSSSTNLPTEKSQGKDSNLPSHWSAMSRDEQFTRVKLEASSQEYKTVETLFRNTMKERVTNISIERVQNPFMWEKYCRKKENMATVKTQGKPKTSANEKRLFHGTSPEAVVAICKQNFDWRLHGKNATKYGEGSYFAVNASYSHSYAKLDVDSCQYMFLANVLVGSYTKGHSDLRRPPAINPSNPESDLYDSCVDDKYYPTIFVVFDTDQFYPAYVIKYSVVSQNAPADARNYGAQQPAQTSRLSTEYQVFLRSLGMPIYSGTPGYASGSRSSSSVQSSHATRSSNPRSVTQVPTPQYQISRGPSSSAAPNVLRSSPSFSASPQARQASPTSTDGSKPNCSVM